MIFVSTITLWHGDNFPIVGVTVPKLLEYGCALIAIGAAVILLSVRSLSDSSTKLSPPIRSLYPFVFSTNSPYLYDPARILPLVSSRLPGKAPKGYLISEAYSSAIQMPKITR